MRESAPGGGARRPARARFKGGDWNAEVLFVGHWLDALAKASTGRRALHRDRPRPEAVSPSEAARPEAAAAAPPQGLTRRTLLRRGAVVGAVVWTTPILQTALAPAASASAPPPCTSNCPVGTPCASGANCASGLVCTGGVCKIPYGGSGTCATGTDCQSGNCSLATHTCIASWPGTTCTSGSQCLSNKCVGGRCFENAVGGYCRTTADCTDNTTCPTGSGMKVCGGPGATCANKNKCVSGNCKNGVCQ